MEKQDLIKFIKGYGNAGFQQSVIGWIKSSPENRSYYNQVKAEFVSKFDNELKLDIEEEYNRFTAKRKRKNRNVYFVRIAAVITVVILLGSGLLLKNEAVMNQNVSYKAPQKTQKEIILSDGSKVILNSDSSLEMLSFNENEREVKLIGEAFFEVIKDESRAFVVNTESGMSIRVLGTSFNVKSYKTDETIETTLVTGKVEIYKGSETKPALTLVPNQKAIYNKNESRLIVDQVEPSKIISWKEGILNFDNEPIINVLANLERWYGFKIRVEENEIETYRFTGKIHKKNRIQEVLELIKTSSPVDYRYNEKNEIIIFKKRN